MELKAGRESGSVGEKAMLVEGESRDELRDNVLENNSFGYFA